MESVPVSTGPTVHGVYDYWLGGADHLRADRELGKAIEERFPSVPAHVRAAREFHLRAARWCAGEGIARFVCAGAATWHSGGRNVHEAAREVNPAAEAVYVNRDAEAHDWSLAALDGPGTAAARGTGSHPAELLAAAPVAGMLGQGRPVCLILGLTLHFAAPAAARERVALCAAALPPGSVLAVSLALPDASPEADALIAMFTPAPVRRHTARDVTAWLEGAGLAVVPPGVRDVRLVRELEARPPGLIAGALAAKP